MGIFNRNKDKWINQDEIIRVNAYKRYMDLFDGKHQKAFATYDFYGQRQAYIAVNLPRLIANVSADFLFSEPPVVVGHNPEEQLSLDNIISRNNFNVLNYQSALTNAIKGDALYKVRFGKRDETSINPEVIIENIQPDIYFPEIDPDNVNHILSITLAWKKNVGKVQILRKEIHKPGFIFNELWETNEANELIRQLSLTDYYPNLEPMQETGINEILVVHVPNISTGVTHFGQSDFQGLEGLFDEINNRISSIANILDKHSDPKLAVPTGIISNQGYAYKDELELVEVQNGDIIPQYITWDGQLTAAYEELDRLVDMVLMLTEISPSLVGRDAQGGVAESGRALKFRLMNTLRKINRKRNHYESAIKKVLYLAEMLDNLYGSGNYEPSYPDINWNDGLPNDSNEEIDLAIKLKSAGLVDLQGALRIAFPNKSTEAIEKLSLSLQPASNLPSQDSELFTRMAEAMKQAGMIQ